MTCSVTEWEFVSKAYTLQVLLLVWLQCTFKLPWHKYPSEQRHMLVTRTSQVRSYMYQDSFPLLCVNRHLKTIMNHIF